MLAAAAALFAAAETPDAVTMEAVADSAGVGKGTLFRAFGSREGLLDALWMEKSAALRDCVETGAPPLGPGAPAVERAVAFLDAVLSFKLEYRQLIHARERAPRLRQSPRYQWMLDHLRKLIEEAAPGATAEAAAYATYTLLTALHIDLIEELLASGVSPAALRREQAAHARATIAAART